MAQEYLASGFAHVDDRADIAAYATCLKLLDALPYFRAYKRRSYDLLRLTPGLSVLEVGCGLGDDVLRMARRVAPTVKVVGIDLSAALLTEARARAGSLPGVVFLEADARQLPFADATFERCRVDRTLQHIAQPQEVIREMARVLQPGGLLLAYDNDWGTFSVSAPDVTATRLLEDLWCDSFTNSLMGRYLKRYLLEAGLAEVSVFPSVSVTTDFELADRIYNLRQTVRRAVECEMISLEVGESWLSKLMEQTSAGGFLCSVTAYTVVGRKIGRTDTET